MASPAVTYTFANSSVADADQINQNYQDIINALTDASKSLSIDALTCAGNVNLNGNTTIGNASSDDLTVTASLASTLPIKTTNSYDIGSSTIGLRALYFGANSQTVNIKASASMSATWTLTLPITAGTSKFFLQTDGSGVTSWVDVYSGNVDSTDGAIGLTYSSNPVQMFTGFTASRVVTLPTTTVPAGYRITLINTTAFDMVVNASGGSALTIANSANIDATVRSGYVVLQATQATPTTPAHWRVIDLYEKYSHASTWSFDGSGAGTTASLTHKLVRTKEMVTLLIPQAQTTTGTNSTNLIITTAMVVRFRPGTAYLFPVFVSNGGNVSSPLGYIQVGTDGVLTLARDRASTNWTNSTTSGTGTAAYLSWTSI